MAGVKISGLPAIPSSLDTDVGAFVQSGTTYKATLAQISTLLGSTMVLSSVTQVTGLPAALASFVPLAGGTMTGPLILSGDPVVNLGAVTKQYADAIAGGFTVILSCDAASVADVPSTQAGAGVGATLTDNSGTFAVFSIDGVSPALNSRILIKDQAATQNNGVYVLTTQGDTISIPWQLTRATDYDSNTEIVPGTLIAVNTGTVNATTSWLETATVAVVDTDPVLFSQFTFAPSSFLLIANNLSELTASAATARANIGLGTASTKAASDNGEAVVASVTGAFTVGHIATFADTSGTIQDGGAAAGTVTSVGTAGLATGGPITGTGTVTVTAASQAQQEAGTSTAVAVTPGVQHYHPSAAKAWVRFQGNPIVIKASYNVTGVVRNSLGNYTVTFTTPFSSATAYAAFVNSNGNGGGQNGSVIQTYTASTVQLITEDGGGLLDPTNVNVIAFGDQ